MPTRDEVIQGLSAPSRVLSDTVCAICYEPFADPVQLPCHFGHVFCRECVTGWLQSPNHDTCPTDREKLFDLEWASDDSDSDEDEEAEPAAPGPWLTNYRQMANWITQIGVMVDSAPEDALKVEVKEALVPLRNSLLSLLNANAFIQVDIPDYLANLRNVRSRLGEVLDLIRSTDGRPTV